MRFGFIYGAEQTELSALRASLRLGRALTGVDGHAHSHWLHAGDAARAVLLAAQKQPAETVIDVTDNHPASPLAFFSYFSESQGLTAPASGGFNLRALLFGQKPLDAAAIEVHPDVNEAASKLGWTPQFASYRHGIDDLLLTWRAAQTAGGVNA
jgi:2-alkyl-3-oxoalkanoate reductase